MIKTKITSLVVIGLILAAGAVVLIATIIMAPEVAATLVGTAAKLLPATFIAA